MKNKYLNNLQNLKTKRPPFFLSLRLPLFAAVFALLIPLFQSCAFKVAPSGGPVDRQPPVVVASFPPPDSTGIKVLPHVDILFSEKVDHSSFKGQVWLLPRPPKPLKLKWKGKKNVQVIIPERLDKDQTYILTLGTGIRDLHRNRMAEPFVLPFSTGRKIDQGEISGYVQASRPQNVFIYAYPLPDSSGDAPLFRHRPRYYTQAGKDGRFRLKFLKAGKYRVFALEDRGGDGLYSRQVDRIGLPAADVVLDSTHLVREKINFWMTLEDTTRPVLSRSIAVSRTEFDLLFTEPLIMNLFLPPAVVDSVSGKKLRVLAVARAAKDPRRIRVFTEKQQPGSRYLGLISGAQDTVGNALRPQEGRFKLTASTLRDTTRFSLTKKTPPPGKRDVRYHAPIGLSFSLPVDSASLDSSVSILRNHSSAIKGRWRFPSLMNPEFQPDSVLTPGAQFTVRLNLAGIYSIFGAVLGDSVLTYSFKTIDFALLGEIAGTIHSAGSNTQAILSAYSLGTAKQSYRFIVPVNKPYLFPNLPQGIYRLKAVVDVNANGKFDRGSSNPFHFAEPFQFYPDTVKVRKRWTTTGINFSFRK